MLNRSSGRPRHVVDRLLVVLHPRDILLQCGELLRIVRGFDQAQRQQLVLGIEILRDALLDDPAEVLPELRIIFRFLLLHFLEGIEDLLRQPLPDLRNMAVFLETLPRNIQRKVGRVHDAAHESQI